MPCIVETNLKFLSLCVHQIEHLYSFFASIENYIRKEIDKQPNAESLLLLAGRLWKGRTDIAEMSRERSFAYCFYLVLKEIAVANDRAISIEVSDLDIASLAARGFSQFLREFLENPVVAFEYKASICAIWRSLLMNTFSMRAERRSENILLSIGLDEIKKCLREYRDHLNILKQEPIVNVADAPAEPGRPVPFFEGISSYSRAWTINPSFFCRR